MPIPALVNALQALGAAFSVGHASSAAGGAVAATGAAKDTGVATAAATSSTVSSATGGVKVRNTGVSVPHLPAACAPGSHPELLPQAASLGSALKASAVGTLDVSKDVWTGVKVRRETLQLHAESA
jgi:hypothetical protein